MGAPGGVGLLARAGDPAPGFPGDTFGNLSPFFPLVVNGRFAFHNIVFPSGSTGIWMGEPGAFPLIAKVGDAVPGTDAGVTFSGFERLTLNPSGDVSVRAVLTGTGVTSANNHGIWAGSGGTLQMRVRTGTTATGFGGQFSSINHQTHYPINSSGQVLFWALVSGVPISSNTGLWISSAPNSANLVIREGAAAPSIPGVFLSGDIDAGDINNAGTVIFRSYLIGSGVNSSNDEAYFTGAPGSLSVAVRKGDLAPGASGTFGSISASIAGDGRITVSGQAITGGGQLSGMWAGPPGSLSLVALQGNPAPDTPAGVVFGVGFYSTMTTGNGRLALSATLAGAGVDSSNDRGIWMTDDLGDLHLVVRKGDVIPVAPGRCEKIIELYSVGSNGENGSPTALNSSGQLAVTAIFENGMSGQFIAEFNEDPPPLDGDGDGWPNSCDNCNGLANPTQADADADNVGDACDTCTDLDGDGYGDPGFPLNTCPEDQCPSDPDKSEPGVCGCDVIEDTGDDDGDGAVNCLDQCPNTAACAVVVDPEYGCPWYDCEEYELGCNPALADIDYFSQMLLEDGYDCNFDLSGEGGYPDGVINGWDMQSYVRALLNQ